jgi:hypothetical protein
MFFGFSSNPLFFVSSLMMTRGNVLELLFRPLTAGIFAFGVVMLGLSHLIKMIRRKGKKS